MRLWGEGIDLRRSRSASQKKEDLGKKEKGGKPAPGSRGKEKYPRKSMGGF